MHRYALILILMAVAVAPAHAVQSIEKMMSVEETTSSSDDGDYGPGETPGDTSAGVPACTSWQQAETVECTASPETPLFDPATAPDECIDWYYDDFWGDLYQCG